MDLLNKLFGFDAKTMTIRKEIIAGITTFLTMSYILAVSPSLLGQTGMDSSAVFTTTILASVIATMFMGVYAKYPFALAPGMGILAFFVYTIVLTMGYSWQFALTAVFIEGLIFILLTITGLRNKLVEAMPHQIRTAISPGIGLFITFIGLRNAGIIVSSEATAVTLGNMHSPAVLLACFGIIVSAILIIRNVMGALLIGILITTIVGIPLGITQLDNPISFPPSITPIFCKMEWSHVFTIDMLICVITMLFMDLFDTLGSILGVGNRVGMVDNEGNMPGLNKAFMADAIGTTCGAILGTSTISTYVESAAGVNAGGRSGLTAVVTACCFLLSLFFAPLFLAVPAAATAPAMVLVGVMMMGNVDKIDFSNYLTAIPCFICIAIMPLAYSISDGILLSVITWVILHLLSGHYKDLKIKTIIISILFALKYALL